MPMHVTPPNFDTADIKRYAVSPTVDLLLSGNPDQEGKISLIVVFTA
jgi:hypothetical protein